MSVYRCGICEEYKDADFDGCEAHPSDECECICENCSEYLEYQAELARDSYEEILAEV